MRRRCMYLVVCMAVLFALFGCAKNQKEQIALEPLEEGSEYAGEDETEMQTWIYVHVCGAVKSPGVYALAQESRVYEAIQMAGGFTEEAAVTQINQAELVQDEGYIYVPTLHEVESGYVSEVQAGDSQKVNLNRATKEQLMTIPGIGEAKANQIVAYRQEHGTFKSIEDVMNISGIKEGLFEKIKDYITV